MTPSILYIVFLCSSVPAVFCCEPTAGADPHNRLATCSRGLVIHYNYLPFIKQQGPAAAAAKTIGSVELVMHKAAEGELTMTHFGVKILLEWVDDSKDGVDNPVLYHLAGTSKKPHDERERLTGLLKARYPYTILTVTKPTEAGTATKLTLGRILQCISSEGLVLAPPRTRGRCYLFALRVIRFASGNCKCNECHKANAGDIRKYQKFNAVAPSVLTPNQEGLKAVEAATALAVSDKILTAWRIKEQKSEEWLMDTRNVMKDLVNQVKSITKLAPVVEFKREQLQSGRTGDQVTDDDEKPFDFMAL